LGPDATPLQRIDAQLDFLPGEELKKGIKGWLGYKKEKNGTWRFTEDSQTMIQNWEFSHLEELGTTVFQELQMVCRWEGDTNLVLPKCLRSWGLGDAPETEKEKEALPPVWYVERKVLYKAINPALSQAALKGRKDMVLPEDARLALLAEGEGKLGLEAAPEMERIGEALKWVTSTKAAKWNFGKNPLHVVVYIAVPGATMVEGGEVGMGLPMKETFKGMLGLMEKVTGKKQRFIERN
jgi:hypothetical protein